MCFDTDSLPPIPAISGAAVSHDDLVLEAKDGNRFAAFAASPDEPAATGVVILPDVRGLYRFYEELALRFAELGHRAVAFDYFGRTAGVSGRGDDFEYMEHVKETTPEGIQADVGACVAYLRDHGATAIFTVGFCMGGRNSWLASAAGHGLAGAVGFYGRPPLEDAREPHARPAPRSPGGGGRAHHRRGQRSLRRRAHSRRRRARARRVRRRAAQLLRPEAGGVPGRLRRRVAADVLDLIAEHG